MTGRNHIKGILMTTGAAVCFGALPSVVINAYETGINVMTMQLLRHLIAGAALLCFCALRGWLRTVTRNTVLKLLVAAVLLFVPHATLYSFAVTLLPVATASLILFLFPIFISALSVLLGREKISPLRFLTLLSAFGGLSLMLLGGLGALNLAGVLCALTAAVLYAVYCVLIAPLTAGISPVLTNALINLGSAGVLLVVTPLSGNLALDFPASTWVAILFNAVGVGIVAHSMTFAGIKHLGPVEASAIAMTEPLFAAIASFLILGQTLSLPELLGGAVLLGAIFAFAALRSRAVPAKRPAGDSVNQ
jgi:drug/metabolite transporter (DMT)-like permease